MSIVKTAHKKEDLMAEPDPAPPSDPAHLPLFNLLSQIGPGGDKGGGARVSRMLGRELAGLVAQIHEIGGSEHFSTIIYPLCHNILHVINAHSV